jgi:precorrin-2 dehydrogenase/sirohydrochlorin ferrochelatase
MSYYPIFLEMKERRCLVIGGGVVAQRKVAALLQAGARATVIAPALTADLAEWSEQKRIHAVSRAYRNGDLAGYKIVFVATDDREVNAAIYAEGKSRGVWVNAADDPARCDFILPSVLRRGPLTIAVSSGATSPGLARMVREELESYFDCDYEVVAEVAAEAREELQVRGIAPDYEKWRQALANLKQWAGRDGRREAKEFLLKQLGAI